MRTILTVLAAALLALGGCCTTTPESCKKEGKAMSCDMKAGCSCCAKGGDQGHQH
jgi:hypothetical protein